MTVTKPLDSIILSLSVGAFEQAQKEFNAEKNKLPKRLAMAIKEIFESKTEALQMPLKPQVMARQIRRICGKPARAFGTSDSIIHILSYLHTKKMVTLARVNRLWNSLKKQALVYQLSDPLRVQGFDDFNPIHRNVITTYEIDNYRKAGLSSKTIFEALGGQLRKVALYSFNLCFNRSDYLGEMNQACPNIEFLKLSSYTAGEFQSDHFISLASLQNLCTLDLNKVAMPHTVFASLGNFTSLTTLSLTQTSAQLHENVRFPITVSDCSVFKEIPRLQSLSLTNFEFNDDLMTHIVGCRNLKMLSLCFMYNLTDRSLFILSQAPSLSSLKLTYCKKILGTGLIAGLPKLRNLKLCYMEQFSREGLTFLVQNSPSLIELIFIQDMLAQSSSGQEEAQEIIRSRRATLTVKK